MGLCCLTCDRGEVDAHHHCEESGDIIVDIWQLVSDIPRYSLIVSDILC